MTRIVLAIALLAAACGDNLEPELAPDAGVSARVNPDAGPPNMCDHVHHNRYGECCAYLEAGCPPPAGVCTVPDGASCAMFYCGPTPADWPLVCSF